MKSDRNVFLKVWFIVFKYLFLTMLAVLIFRTLLLFSNGEGDTVTMLSVFTGLSIALFGTGAIAALIAWIAFKSEKKK